MLCIHLLSGGASEFGQRVMVLRCPVQFVSGSGRGQPLTQGEGISKGAEFLAGMFEGY